jgi:hypothetical protein
MSRLWVSFGKPEGLFMKMDMAKGYVGHLFSNVVNQEQGNTIVKY